MYRQPRRRIFSFHGSFLGLFSSRLPWIAPLFFLASCGLSGSGSKEYRDPFDLTQNKVHLKESQLTPGLSLAVLVDESCWTSRATQALSSSASFLTQRIEVDPDLPRGDNSGARRSAIQTHRVDIERPVLLSEIQASADADPCILGVGPNQIAAAEEIPSPTGTRDSTNDPMADKQTHLASIHALESYPIFFNPDSGIQKELTIAFIDTGIDLKHNDLKTNLWVNEKELNGKPNEDDDGDGYVDDIHGYNFPSRTGDPSHETVNDHGSHVAGLAAAVSSNGVGGIGVIGRKVRIMALNVFGKNWGAETVDIDTAIRFAADHGANVINLSIGGGGQSDTTAAAIVYALNHGSLVVTSAGNLHENIEEDFYFPASYAPQYAGLISVGASNSTAPGICDFSNYSPMVVKIAAPGCDDRAPRAGLFSTLSGDSYGYKKGTSMSAPIVSGAAALAYGLLRDRRGGGRVKVAEIEDLLNRSSEHAAFLDSYIIGGRVIDLKKLADEIDKLYPFKL